MRVAGFLEPSTLELATSACRKEGKGIPELMSRLIVSIRFACSRPAGFPS